MSLAEGRDAYAALGVHPRASQADLKRAYKALVREFHPDKNQDPAAADRFIEVQKAWEAVGEEAKREAYDDSKRQRQHQHRADRGGARGARGGGFGGFESREFARTEAIPSETVTLTKASFARTVLGPRSGAWLVQVYADASAECQRLAPLWENAARSLEGAVHLGRVDAKAQYALAAQLAGGRELRPNSLPIVVAFAEGCRDAACGVRLRGAERGGLKLDALTAFAMDEAAMLDAVPEVTLESVANQLLEATPEHKVRVLVVTTKAGSGSGGGSVKLRRLATERRMTHAFAVARYREADAAQWRKSFGIRSAPAILLLREEGEEPYVHHGAASYEELVALLSEHGSLALPPLRSARRALWMGCDAFGESASDEASDARVCLVLVARAGDREAKAARRALRGARSLAVIEGESAGVGAALERRELAFAWLDADVQIDAARALLELAGRKGGVPGSGGTPTLVALWPASGTVEAYGPAIADTRTGRAAILAFAHLALGKSEQGLRVKGGRLPALVDQDEPSSLERLAGRLRAARRAVVRRAMGIAEDAVAGQGGWLVPVGGAILVLLLPRILAAPKSPEQKRREAAGKAPLVPGKLRVLNTQTERLIPKRGVYVAVIVKPPMPDTPAPGVESEDGVEQQQHKNQAVLLAHMRSALEQGNRLAEHFKGEKRVRVMGVDSSMAPGWVRLADALKEGAGLEGAAHGHQANPGQKVVPYLVTVWHPSRTKVAVVGLLPEVDKMGKSMPELTAARIERLLDGSATWVPASWPKAPLPRDRATVSGSKASAPSPSESHPTPRGAAPASGNG